MIGTTLQARSYRRVVSRLERVRVADGDPVPYGQPAQSADAVAQLVAAIIQDRPTEVFLAVLLNGKHKVIAVAEISTGTATSSLVHPGEVFGPALRMGAVAVIVAHNHPSGDPEPSAEDLAVTRRLVEAGRILGVPILDHVVIGDGRHVSIRDRIAFD